MGWFPRSITLRFIISVQVDGSVIFLVIIVEELLFCPDEIRLNILIYIYIRWISALSGPYFFLGFKETFSFFFIYVNIMNVLGEMESLSALLSNSCILNSN